jgi:hypothetical protein
VILNQKLLEEAWECLYWDRTPEDPELLQMGLPLWLAAKDQLVYLFHERSRHPLH